MVFDNSKRMERLQEMMKSQEVSKRSKPRRKPRSEQTGAKPLRKVLFAYESNNSVQSLLSMASAASANSRNSIHSSANSSVARSVQSNRSQRSSRSAFSRTLSMDPKHCVLIQESWKTMKQEKGEDYREQLGEQLILRMMEMEPSSRSALGISSFRSPRYGKICNMLVDTAEAFIQMLGPNFCEAECIEMGEEWKHEGIDPSLVKDALSHCVKSSLPADSWTENVAEAWQATLPGVLDLAAHE